MTCQRSEALSESRIKNPRCPVKLGGCVKDYLWGGSRLIRDYGARSDSGTAAELWECSVHPDGESVICSGAYAGTSLREYLEKHPDHICIPGSRNMELGEDGFPVLVKLIDAADDLSIQVHPDDAYARIHENGSRGKSEFWYILDAEPGAELVYGFYRDISREELDRALEDRSITNYVQRVPVRKNDVFYVKAGTVHAVCRGIVLAEVQETSNLTYRLYDYERRDKNGALRPLHIEKAREVIDLSRSPEPRQPMRLIRYAPGVAEEFVFRCQYFEIHRLLVSAEEGEAAIHRSGDTSFEVLLCTEGEGTIAADGMEDIGFSRGSCFFVPAASEKMKISGKGEFLLIHC